jgi:hypothetical protein
MIEQNRPNYAHSAESIETWIHVHYKNRSAPHAVAAPPCLQETSYLNLTLELAGCR